MTSPFICKSSVALCPLILVELNGIFLFRKTLRLPISALKVIDNFNEYCEYLFSP